MRSKYPLTVLDSLNAGLFQALADDPQAILLGEDLLDPYGGSFKVTRGLSSQFPGRVLTTPISEAGITGIAGGMALRGLHPVVEIMFGDFTTLIVDQVVNHLTKFTHMYRQNVSVPVVVRTPMGGRRGYGPTHSQTLEKLFLGVPGLTVLAPFHAREESPLGSPGKLLHTAVTSAETPTFFVENKLQYLLKLFSEQESHDLTLADLCLEYGLRFPFYRIAVRSAPSPQITLCAYGYMTHLAMAAMHALAYENEIFAELLVPTCLAPFNLSPLFNSVSETGRLLTIEEGTFSLGWGAEVLARASEALGPKLRKSRRLAAKETVVPAAPSLEAEILPGENDIVACVREMAAGDA